MDSDADGITSAAIFYNYFNTLFPMADMKYKMHEGKEHGVRLEFVPVTTDIVVIIDAGTNQIDEQEELSRQDRHVLIIDHHVVSKVTPIKNVVIVNNQSSDHYYNKNLSGAGVVFKVIQAYDERYGSRILYKRFEDLAAVGIVGDCMDTRNLDNNAIISNGLKNIHNNMLKALLEQQSFSVSNTTSPNKIDIAFYITPLINAVIRSGTMEEKTLFFEGFINNGSEEIITSISRGRERSETLYQFLARTAVNLRARQNKKKENSVEAIVEQVIEKGTHNNACIIVRIDQSSVPQNITGLVAMEISKLYNKPTLVLRPVLEDGEFYYRGSGRASSVSGAESFMSALNQSGLMDYVEGHDNAFGASVKDRDIAALNEFLNDYYKDIDFSMGLEVDCSMNDSNWNILALKEFGEIMHVYGNGIPQPKFHFDFVVGVNDCRIQGKNSNSLKINYRGLTFVAFRNDELVSQYERLSLLGRNLKVEIIGRSQINEWQGYRNVQIIIDKIEMVTTTSNSKTVLF